MRVIIAIAALNLIACSSTLAVQQANTKVLGAYTMFAPSTTETPNIYARVIVDGVLTDASQCPSLISNKAVTPMTLRAKRPNPAHFPVTVCEAKLRSNTAYTVTNSAFSLAPVTFDPKKIAVFGDTGCKSSVCKNNSAAEPFKSLTAQGAQQRPQLLLHMGDLNYRGTGGAISGDTYAYDAGDGGYGGASCGLNDTYYSQNALNSPRPDTWSNWQADFFFATRQLSTSAPWIFARGNHELCSRAGVGWFYFFGPGAALPDAVDQQQCPAQGDYTQPPKSASAHIIVQNSYTINLKPLSIWVMDSANACDASADNGLTKVYQQQYQRLNVRSELLKTKPMWIMSHRPIWGVENPTTKDTLNVMLQTALKRTKSGQLPDHVKLSLAGHMHIYQSSTFATSTARPPQIVVGNSGVSLSNTNAFSEYDYNLDGENAVVNTQGKFGFLSIELGKGGKWQGQFLDENGAAFLTCDSEISDKKAVCLAK
ncbi:metallophosphoesterase [Pseudoalteromonas sp. McH1-7]|uniref:metallophosphoesterase n=1 Tax=Pseudoalteromonas sp. McH1-7 TaxID=2745574 RepID=UPI0015922578|nr:metallophosphoesterase [Pseudoalteromonas sp. McH1-7]NUZ11711.1 metallophosphoesterase [Pseudoalteromonas sp. McH1-7]